MDINMCVKYIDFLQLEVIRFIEDGSVEDEEIRAMAIELTKFKIEVEKSKLPSELKKKIEVITYDFSPKKLKLSIVILFIFILTLGVWAVIINTIQQRKRVNNLLYLKDQIKAISNDLKLNHKAYSI